MFLLSGICGYHNAYVQARRLEAEFAQGLPVLEEPHEVNGYPRHINIQYFN